MNSSKIIILLFLLMQGYNSNYILPGTSKGIPRPPLPHTIPLEPHHIDEMAQKLHSTAHAMEKLNVFQHEQPGKGFDPLWKVQDSLDAIGDLLADHKAVRHINKITQGIGKTRKIADMQNMMSSIGPLLSAFDFSDFNMDSLGALSNLNLFGNPPPPHERRNTSYDSYSTNVVESRDYTDIV